MGHTPIYPFPPNPTQSRSLFRRHRLPPGAAFQQRHTGGDAGIVQCSDEVAAEAWGGGGGGGSREEAVETRSACKRQWGKKLPNPWVKPGPEPLDHPPGPLGQPPRPPGSNLK